MRTKHLALILGVVGLVAALGLLIAFRPGRGDPDVLSPSLTPLTRLSPLVVDRITVRDASGEVTLLRGDKGWTVGRYKVFDPAMEFLWQLLREIHKAPTVASNPANHSDLGVTQDQALSLTFWRDNERLDELLVGLWSPEARGTFIRRPPEDAVAGIGIDLRSFLAPTSESWRDRFVLDMRNLTPRSLRLSYPDGEFTLRFVVAAPDGKATPRTYSGAGTEARDTPAAPGAPAGAEEPSQEPVSWVIESPGAAERDADSEAMSTLLARLGSLQARGFDDEQWEPLGGATPLWSLEVVPLPFGAAIRLDFHSKDEATNYVRKSTTKEVFLVDARAVLELMVRAEELEARPQQEVPR